VPTATIAPASMYRGGDPRPAPRTQAAAGAIGVDELFLHPQWGLLGSLVVFAAVLFVVFEVSTWLDTMTSAKLVALASGWQPLSTGGVIGRAVLDGLIVSSASCVPYMIPLVLLLVALEESGIMHRIAFVVDRGFHHLGLHGGRRGPVSAGARLQRAGDLRRRHRHQRP